MSHPSNSPPSGGKPINSEQYVVYRSVIQRVLNDEEHLPSLPSITLKIRHALADDNTTTESLAQMIGKDPALSALLMKTASSPLYRTLEQPQAIRDVIALLGMQTIGNLTMLHSVRSVFLLRSPKLKKLFTHTWKRLAIKASFASLLAQKIGYQPADQAMMTALLSEVGSLSVLSALQELPEVPTDETYFALCRNYSKSLGSILLSKWSIEKDIIDVIKKVGQWEYSHGEQIQLIDIVNLALYNTILHSASKSKPLPPINTLAAYKKLKPPYNILKKPSLMGLVVDNKDELSQMVKSFV